MSTDWKTDKRWSDKFLTDIKRILGECLITEPPICEDSEHNTDLIVLKFDSVRIACRVRKHKYAEKYGDEFTIRKSRPNGHKSELTKIIEGWGDYLFYGFSDELETCIDKWKLIDLKAVRLFINRSLVTLKGSLPGLSKDNHDGSSDFLAISTKENPQLIFKQSQ